MYRTSKPLLVAGIIAGSAALGSVAPAGAVSIGQVTVFSGSGTMSHAASAGSSRLVVNGSVTHTCATTDSTSVVATGPVSAAPIASVQVQPGSCSDPFASTSWTCTSTTDHSLTGLPSGGVTPGTYSGISCLISSALLGCSATVTGSVPVTYTNPTKMLPGRVTMLATGQSLNVSGSTCPGFILPNGVAQWTSPGGGNLAFTLTANPALQPFIRL